MKAYIFRFVLVVLLFAQYVVQAQDFLLQIPFQDSISEEIWMKKLREQATDLAYRGFTYIGFPESTDKKALTALVKTLQQSGLKPMLHLNIPNGADVFQTMPLSESLHNDFQINSFRISSEETPKPVIIANFLKAYYDQNSNPSLVFTDIPNKTPQQLGNWVNDVNKNLPEESRENILPRVYDYPLREALRQAIENQSFDVREIYKSSVRDATTLIGYNVVTGVNGGQLEHTNKKADDWGGWIEEPLLAYAYLLTNNQVGLPEIFYADYFGKESGDQRYLEKQPLKKEIDQLLKVHREFIFGSTELEYLNQIETDKQNVYQSAAQGADATRVLIFQLDGTQTPAGKAGKGARDILVAINFASVTLKVVQELNMSNLHSGDIFTDILGRSASLNLKVENNVELNIPNAVYIELPPRSYAIWVKGEAPPVTLETIALSVEAFDDFVALTWENPIEKDIKGYEIEKSINGSPFKKMNWIDALNEMGADYLYTDEERLSGESIAYRVKTVYKDGSMNYSSIQEIKPFVKELSFELVETTKPNVKTIKIKSNLAEDSKVIIFNVEGKSVMTFHHAIKKGVSLAQIDLTTLPKGIYLLNIEAQGKIWTKKIVNR